MTRLQRALRSSTASWVFLTAEPPGPLPVLPPLNDYELAATQRFIAAMEKYLDALQVAGGASTLRPRGKTV